jgi:hypothetical protein
MPGSRPGTSAYGLVRYGCPAPDGNAREREASPSESSEILTSEASHLGPHWAPLGTSSERSLREWGRLLAYARVRRAKRLLMANAAGAC